MTRIVLRLGLGDSLTIGGRGYFSKKIFQKNVNILEKIGVKNKYKKIGVKKLVLKNWC